MRQTLWLLRRDIAWRSIRQAAPTRFIAYCLLSDYVWLGISGTLSMIFGHSLIIFPGVMEPGFPSIGAFTFIWRCYTFRSFFGLQEILTVMGRPSGWAVFLM